MSSSDLFYAHLPSFTDFHGITDERNFQTVPDDWFVILTDVKGSTAAIEAGRYKDVNTVGAAAIACVQNTLGELEFPFVFGGDGATLLVSADIKEKVVNALAELKGHSVERFGLELRVGVVAVAELVREGIRLEVAKYRLAGTKCVAIFRGGGLSLAEMKVKKNPTQYEVAAKTNENLNMNGLSCRWQAIPSKAGSILAVLVTARSQDHGRTYSEILQRLSEIYDGRLDSANPMRDPKVNYKSFWTCVSDEARQFKSIWTLGFLWRFLGICFSFAVFVFRVPPLVFDPYAYTTAIATHSDYRKFDDALRMILDASPKQIAAIKTEFETRHKKGEIFYGLHESPTSLMTCYVNGVTEGRHIHFIDGGDGGYAIAAKSMKKQMNPVG